MDLPVGVWMQVFENLDHRPHKTRFYFVDKFATAVNGDTSREVEQTAVQQLSKFEIIVWKTTRLYYAINRASRAAAKKLSLCATLLSGCESVPIVTGFKQACPVLLESASSVTENRIVLPQCFTIDVSHPEIYKGIHQVYTNASQHHNLSLVLDTGDAAILARNIVHDFLFYWISPLKAVGASILAYGTVVCWQPLRLRTPHTLSSQRLSHTRLRDSATTAGLSARQRSCGFEIEGSWLCMNWRTWSELAARLRSIEYIGVLSLQ